MAQIRKRGTSQYQARVRLKGHPEFNKTFTTRKEAALWALQQETLLGQGLGDSLYRAERVTLGKALERYGAEVSPLKKGHHQEVKRIRRWLENPLAQLPLPQVRGSDLAQFRDARLAGGVSGNTVRLDMALISHLYEVARKDWGFETLQNPVKACRTPLAARGWDWWVLPG
jgi:hypothetical protein